LGSEEVPSLDLPATDSGTVAKSRDGSTAPSDVLDGTGIGQVGEHTGVLDNSGWQNALPDLANLGHFRYSDSSFELQSKPDRLPRFRELF
jgi:hypothetical protein